jgi:hypothetical protein
VPHARVLDRSTKVNAYDTARVVERMGRRGRDVRIVRTDLEHIVKPWPDVPEWPAMTIGCLLMADSLDAGALAYGTTLESRFLGQGYGWNARALTGEHWHTTFAAVGMPWLRATTGLTEIATLRMALDSPIGDLVRWCVAGTVARACGRCAKCVRKEILTAAVLGRPLDTALIENADLTKGKNRMLLGAPPYYFQNVLEYAVPRLGDLSATPLAGLAQHLAHATVASTAWMERYFSDAYIFDVPPAQRSMIETYVNTHMGHMTAAEETSVRSYSTGSTPDMIRA